METQDQSCGFWDVPRLAAYLGVAPRTVYRMHYSGTGPRRRRVGQRKFGYRWEDIEAWLNEEDRGRQAGKIA